MQITAVKPWIIPVPWFTGPGLGVELVPEALAEFAIEGFDAP